MRFCLLVPLLLGACGEEVELPPGALVTFRTAQRGEWATGVVGTVGHCAAVAVPDSWVSPQRFDVVPLDSLAALRVSRRYDGVRESFEVGQTVPPDPHAGEWRTVPVDRLRGGARACAIGG